MTTFRLGINTCFAVKRWPRPRDWAPVVHDVLGLTIAQHSLDLVDLADGDAARDLREVCAVTGIELHSTFTGLAAYSSNLLMHPDPAARARAEAWYREAIDFTAQAGARATGGHVGAMAVHDWCDARRRVARWADLQASLERLATYARRAGLEEIYVENLAAAREPSTMDGMRDLVRPADDNHAAVVLCLDVGHQCVPGTVGDERDPYAWLRALSAMAPVVQLQQSDANGDHHWPFTAQTDTEGRIVPEAVLAAIEDSGARAVDLILEVIPPFEADDDAVLADLKESVDRWYDALRA